MNFFVTIVGLPLGLIPLSGCLIDLFAIASVFKNFSAGNASWAIATLAMLFLIGSMTKETQMTMQSKGFDNLEFQQQMLFVLVFRYTLLAVAIGAFTGG